MGPLGCVAGLGLHARFGKLFGGALDGALIALTAGTFVYVGATEVVPEEFEDGGASRAKVLALLLGRGDDPRAGARRGPARGESWLKSIDSSYLV